MSKTIWGDLSQADYYRYSSEFMRLTKEDIDLLWGERFSLFVQFKSNEKIKPRVDS